MDSRVIQPLQQFSGAVGGIPVDRSLRFGFGFGFGFGGESVVEEFLGDFGVSAVAWGGRGGGDDLRVGVEGDVALVAVEATRRFCVRAGRRGR